MRELKFAENLGNGGEIEKTERWKELRESG